MPYKTDADLPESVRKALPAHAQDIYRAAFNSAWEEYSDASKRHGSESREEAAHRVTWAAVKEDGSEHNNAVPPSYSVCRVAQNPLCDPLCSFLVGTDEVAQRGVTFLAILYCGMLEQEPSLIVPQHGGQSFCALV